MKPRSALYLSQTLCLLACALGPQARSADPDPAQQLDQQYPQGSITTRERADRALADADAVHERVQAQYDAERRRCEHVFLVNHCLGNAHEAERDAERIVQRITLEAHDLRRALDAREHDRARAQELQQQAEQERLRSERERQAKEDARAREQAAAGREEDAKKTEETARKAQADTASHQQAQQAGVAREEEQRAAREAAAQQAFKEKQEQAAAYAASKEEDKKANEARRAERQAQREAQERKDQAEPAAPAAAAPSH
jgi:hypothetical protein